MEELLWAANGNDLIIVRENGEREIYSAKEIEEMGYELPNPLSKVEEAERYYDDEHEQAIKKLAGPYGSTRWRGLNDTSNFLKVDDRKELLRYLQQSHTMASLESQRLALQGYYSSLLELTYVIGDYFWASKTKKNKDDKVEDVVKMLKNKHMDNVDFASLVHIAETRMSERFSELNQWLEILYFQKLNTSQMRGVSNFLGDQKRIKWFRDRVRKLLAKLDTSVPPANLAFLFRQRYVLEEKQIKKKFVDQKSKN